MREAIKRGSVPALPSRQTIAEGIAVKEPGEITRAIIAERVRDIFVVGEAEIEHALATILEIEKTVIEGAAAAAFAAVLAHPGLFAGRKVGIVLSGGNIDMRLLSVMIMRELMREGRILTLELQIEDRPGQLARVASIVAEAGGNILEVSHNRLLAGTPAKGATLGLVVEARDGEHANAIRRGLQDGGFLLVG
jgi:threonine dehydratase